MNNQESEMTKEEMICAECKYHGVSLCPMAVYGVCPGQDGVTLPGDSSVEYFSIISDMSSDKKADLLTRTRSMIIV